jgi:hypothetical protein
MAIHGATDLQVLGAFPKHAHIACVSNSSRSDEDIEDVEKGHQAFEGLKLNPTDNGSPKPRQQLAGNDSS